MAKKKDNNILIWKPNDLDGFFHVQTLEGHKSDINGLIELKDGRLASSSKDRTIRIWKGIIKEDKEKQNVVEFHIDEILNEHKHGIYLIMQLNDERIFSSTSESAIVIWKDNKFLAFC
jgi:WD40 repeat protein